MPFTASHALVAIPFARSPLVPAAIAVGAMTPDLPLFLPRIGISYAFTHTAQNAVWTALIALVLLLIWRLVLRPAFTELAPGTLPARLPESWRSTGTAALGETLGSSRRPLQPVLLVASLVLGVLSHIAWDAFTHEGRWGVRALPILDAQWGGLPGYKWLQYGSGAGGLLVLGLCAVLWLRARPVHHRPRLLPGWLRWAWYFSLPTALVAAWFLGLAVHGPLSTEFTVRHLAYAVLPPACGLWGVATLLLCLAISLRRDPRSRDATAAPAPVHQRG